MPKMASNLQLWSRSSHALTKVNSPFIINFKSSHTAQVSPILRSSTPVVRLNTSIIRQIANSPSSKAEIRPPKLHTALLHSQDGSEGVVEYTL